MTPMSEERLNELDSWGGKLVSEAQRLQGFGELVRELRRLRDVPPEVAAAMERYTRHIESENCAASSPYFDAHGFDDLQRLTDVLAIAAHFTTLFHQKGT